MGPEGAPGSPAGAPGASAGAPVGPEEAPGAPAGAPVAPEGVPEASEGVPEAIPVAKSKRKVQSQKSTYIDAIGNQRTRHFVGAKFGGGQPRAMLVLWTDLRH